MPLVLKPSVRTDRIVQAAGQLFSHQGFHGTSTREIARLADVSENTLFRHFDNKEQLFWSSLQSYSVGLKFHRDVLEGLTQCDSPEVVLPKIIEMVADIVNHQPELLRLIAIAFVELHPKAGRYSSEYLAPVLSTINHYLQMNIRSGRIRDLDSAMLTSGLIMTGLIQAGISNLIDGNKQVCPNKQEAHSAYARFWLDSIIPRMPVCPSPIVQTKGESPG